MGGICRGGRNKAKEATSSRFRELEWRGRGRGKGKEREKEKEQKKEDEQKNRGWREARRAWTRCSGPSNLGWERKSPQAGCLAGVSVFPSCCTVVV